MEDLLSRFEVWCKANRPDYLATLAPPADDSEIARLAEMFPGLPEDLLALFRWHNGNADPDDAQAFIHNFALMSVEECLGAAVQLSGLLQAGDFEQEWWWDTRWVPFLGSWGGSHLCVDVAGCFGGLPGQVVEFWHDDDDRDVGFPSLREWLARFVDGLEAGMFAANDGALEANDQFDEFASEGHAGFPIEADASGKRADGNGWNAEELLANREYLPDERDEDSAP